MVAAQRMINSLGFTEEDLDYNRRGQVSPRQTANLTEEGLRREKASRLLLVIAGIVFIAAVIVGLWLNSMVAFLIFAASALLFGGLGFKGLSSPSSLPYRVEKIHGAANVYSTAYFESGTEHYLEVQGYKFVIDETTYHRLKNQAPYTVYFALFGNAHTLLSVESHQESAQ